MNRLMFYNIHVVV